MRLVLGTAQVGLLYGINNQNGQVDKPTAKNILELAVSKGIATIDTAISYGESETRLGEIGVEEFKIVTKLPVVPKDQENLSGWVEKQVLGSLGRLGVKNLYGLLLHQPDELLKPHGNKLYQTLQSLKEIGLVQKIGISIYSPVELEVLSTEYKFDMVQAPLNLLDRRLFTSGWLHRLKQDRTEIHTRSPFLQGLLLMQRSAIPSKFIIWSTLLDSWHSWLALNPITAIQACLAYPLSFPEVDQVVVGVDNESQLQQIIEATEADIAQHDLPNLGCDDERLIDPSNWSFL